MPRTKQQRPRHILDENKNGDGTSNELASDGLSSPADTSPDGEYATDSGISDGYSQHPNGEISDCSLSAKSDCERGSTTRDDTAENDAYHRYTADAANDSKAHSPFHLTDEQIKAGINRPFVNPKDISTNELDGSEKSDQNRANYMEMLRSVIAQNMMNKDNANSKNTQPILNANQGGNFHFFGQDQFKEAFKSGMPYPFHVLAKLFHDTIRYNQGGETNNTAPNTEEAITKADSDSNALKMAAAQSIDHTPSSYSTPISKEDRFAISETSYKFVKDESKFSVGSISPQSIQNHPLRANSSSPSASRKSPEGNQNDPRYPQSNWHARTTATVKSDVGFPSKNTSPSMSVEGRSTSMVNNVAKPNKVDTPPQFTDREVSSNHERQRRSPYERALYQTSPLYNTHRRNGSHITEHEKLLSLYPYHTPSPHPPFPLPLAGMGDYHAIRHPYYNPWGLMYRPYHPALQSIPPNPFLQQFPKDSVLVGTPMMPKSQVGLSQRTSPPTSGQCAPKKAASRSKSHSNNPMDTLHAAIVREAKELNKGMDPENMYIECPICHKRIKRLYHFQRHMRIHSGEKSHTCPFCPYKSVRKDNLKSHMKTHEKSKYDGSRRVQNRRDSQSGPSFSLKTDMMLPTDVNKKQPNATSSLPTAEAHTHCKNSPVTAIPNLPYLAQQKVMYNQHNRKEGVSNHTSSIDFPLVAAPRYYHDARFPYGPFPPVPPFMQIPPVNQRPMRESQAFITELSDENSASPKSRKSSTDESSHRIAQRAMKRHSPSPTESEPKRAKSSEGGEPWMFCNANNNNNMDVKPSGILPPYIKDENTEHITLKQSAASERRDSSVISPTKNPLQPLSIQTRPSSYHRTSQNGDSEGTNQVQTSDADTQKIEASEKHIADCIPIMKREDAAISQGHERRIEGTFLSFADASTRNFTDGMQIIPPRRTSSSSLDSVTSNKRDAPEEGKQSRDLKTDLTNPNTWNSLSRESKCRLCDFVATSNSALQEHMSTHKEDGQYKCPQCEYHGKNLSKLIEHIRIHTGERPFQCDQCSYAAKRKDNLAQHKSVKHDKSRNKGPTRVLKLSSQDKPDSAQTAEPVTTHSDYASILYGRNAIGHKDWPYLKSSKNAERFPCFPGDLYAKLRNLPFDGHLPFAGVITGKTGLNFSPNFVNLSPSVQHPSHNNLSSTTTM